MFINVVYEHGYVRQTIYVFHRKPFGFPERWRRTSVETAQPGGHGRTGILLNLVINVYKTKFLASAFSRYIQ